MKQYSIEYTRRNFKTLLKELPFEITRYGRVIAKVMGISTSVVQDVVQDTSRVKTNLIKSATCPHGSMWGLCRKGCK